MPDLTLSNLLKWGVFLERDSLDKVIGGYFARLCTEPFTYKGAMFVPMPLVVSPLIFRGFTCPVGCGGCCPRFSLDYLPTEAHPAGLNERKIVVNDEPFVILSDLQQDHVSWHCRNLQEDGRCGIYSVRPFSCDFELIRLFKYVDRSRLTQQLFGRGWSLLRVDGDRGALCTMTPPTIETTQEVVRKFNRLQEWANYFQIQTWAAKLIEWARTGPHIHPLVLVPNND